MSGSVSYRKDDAVAVISMDDGKVNVLSPSMLGEINDALDRAEGESAGAVVIAGNDRVFSGGFDLKVFRSGDIDASVAMLQGGFNLSHRLLSFPPKPVVAAITGHAIAMGSFLACSSITELPVPPTTFRPTRSRSAWYCPTPPPWRSCGCDSLRRPTSRRSGWPRTSWARPHWPAAGWTRSR